MPSGIAIIKEIKSQYMVACDGGKSKVREKLNINLKGRADMAKFVSIYFRAPEFMKCHKFGTANIYFPLHKEYAGFLLNWDGGTTFTYHLMLQNNIKYDYHLMLFCCFFLYLLHHYYYLHQLQRNCVWTAFYERQIYTS